MRIILVREDISPSESFRLWLSWSESGRGGVLMEVGDMEIGWELSKFDPSRFFSFALIPLFCFANWSQMTVWISVLLQPTKPVSSGRD